MIINFRHKDYGYKATFKEYGVPSVLSGFVSLWSIMVMIGVYV
jgi:hypothetical protein